MRLLLLLATLFLGLVLAYKPACVVIQQMEANLDRLKRNVMETEEKQMKAARTKIGNNYRSVKLHF